MNARAAYLAWVRNSMPMVYDAALRRVAGRPRGTGGLGDDLIKRISSPVTGLGFLGDDAGELDTITITGDSAPTPDVSIPTIDTSSFTTPDLQAIMDNTVLPDVTPIAPTTSTSTFDTLAKAVAAVATAAIGASSQSNLLRVNTARAQQGLPPVDANGNPVRASFLTTSSNPSIARFEAAVAGVAGSPLVWVAAAGLLALLFFRRRSA